MRTYAALLGLLAGLVFNISSAQVPVDPGAQRPASANHAGRPVAGLLRRAGSTSIDLRQLPYQAPRRRERPEREPPQVRPIERAHGPLPQPPAATAPSLSAPAPAPLASYLALDFNNWGAGHPPDTNGDVGPVYFIETVNTSIGIFDKATGTRVAAFTFDTLLSQGDFGNLCDTDNFGDPVVLYDTFEDRWIITDFAFQLDNFNNVVNPPGAFQCFAVSKTGDPVAGGWNFYWVNTDGGLGDYPKLGVWPDAIYMSVNMFDYAASGSFQSVRLYAFNKAQMYAGAPTVQVVSFDAPASEFTLLPANARLQTGTPPAGSPNYFSVVWQYLNVVSVYKFHVDWNSISTSSLTGPFDAITASNWSQYTGTGGEVPTPSNSVDTLYPRLMVQNQYTNIGGVESLWNSHTVGASGTTSALAGVRYYQVKVTGGTVESNATQASTFNPDATIHRFMPSVDVDRSGNMAIAYSATSSTVNPAIRYAGRLAGDAPNTITQTETSLVEGTGSQSVSNRWGDYSSLSLDPDGCTFWLSNMYYITTGGNWQTRIGAFKYPSCTTVSTGSISGTVTATAGGLPIAGATVALGSRTTTTSGSGAYSFSGVASGTYPLLNASAPGFVSASTSNIVVTDGNTTTRNFSLATAPATACLTDTSQADFQLGIPNSVDLTTTPGTVALTKIIAADQHADDNGSGNGFGFSSTSLLGQTFTAGVSGQLSRVDAFIFCASCSGANPDMTLELRTTSGGLPVMTAGGLIASSTIAGTSSGSGGTFSFPYPSAPALAPGTQYGLVIRLASDRTTGTEAWLVSSGDVMANGRRLDCTTTACSTPHGSNSNSDLIFAAYVNTGYVSGDLISSAKDANPASGDLPTWSTLSWNATSPANTLVRFQVAASGSPYGPFNYVGPDGSAATFYTSSGGALTQFNGQRYLRYRAFLSTTNNAATPTLADATVCYANGANPTADLSITKSDAAASATPGATVNYTITAANAGPTAAIGATVADTLPAALTCTWTCAGSAGGTCTASGSGDIDDSVDLPSGGSVTYSAACSIAASATGSLSNTATVTAPPGIVDSMPTNNTATDTDTLAPSANLGITKTDGVTTATPGGSVTYTITASNAGPSNAPGSNVSDTFPGALTCTWTCSGSASGTCSASGSGNINDTVNLPNGGSVTYTASCSVSAAATGSLSNTATVSPSGSVNDATPANNTATDTDTLAVEADVALTITDNRDYAQIGDVLDYVIEVTNPAGPSTAIATVTDTLPAALQGGSWVCTGSGSATCAAGSGNALNDTATIPVGGKASYVYSATVLSAGAADALANMASAALTSGSDPTPGNDAATDTDTVVIFRDGFEGDVQLVTNVNASAAAYVIVPMQVDAGLLDGLGIVPIEVASGRSTDGRLLFALQVARFGRRIELRALTTDANGGREVSAWQPVDLEQRLLEFAWQSAAPGDANGYLAAGGSAGAPLLIDRRATQERLVHLLIHVQNGKPWLVVFDH